MEKNKGVNKMKKVIFMCFALCMTMSLMVAHAEDVMNSPELNENITIEEDEGSSPHEDGKDGAKSPKTGDNTNRFLLPLGVVVIGAVAVGATTLRKKISE